MRITITKDKQIIKKEEIVVVEPVIEEEVILCDCHNFSQTYDYKTGCEYTCVECGEVFSDDEFAPIAQQSIVLPARESYFVDVRIQSLCDCDELYRWYDQHLEREVNMCMCCGHKYERTNPIKED